MNRIAALLVAMMFVVPTVAYAADAAALFGKKCGSCHGKDGKGKTEMGAELKVQDLTDAKVQEKFTDDQAMKSLVEGKKGADGKEVMPGFKGKLTDDEMKEIVKYVRSLKGK